MDRKKGSRESRCKDNLRKSRSKKRKNVVNPKTAEYQKESFSTSAKKLRVDDDEDFNITEDSSVEYRILNFITVFAAISSFVKCKVCNGNVKFETASTRGLGFKISVSCDSCDSKFIPSSPYVLHSYEINRRFIFTMRVLGLGLAGARKFCGLMDMPSFLQESTYSIILKNIHDSVKTAIDLILKKAVKQEIKNAQQTPAGDEIPKLTVSGNGTWRKRGFTSLFGVSSIIGYYSGKVLDICVKSAYCKMCSFWTNKLETAEFDEWFETHKDECSANHEGSSGKMEVDAIIEMFKRSVETFYIKYQNYIGDGDSKTYTGIVNSNPYNDLQVIKKECIGHAQKQMGTRLRGLVKKSKNLGGRGKLTGKMIDKLTVYYGLAIRRNCNSVTDMNKAIWATFYHYSSTDKKPQHENCPTGTDSWCSYQRAQANNESYEHDYNSLPENVLNGMKPIYTDLSKDSLLERCVGGFNQNNNESFNQLIWKISPKIMSSEAIPVNLAAFIATGLFNEGSKSLLFFLNSIGVNCGRWAHGYVEKMDAERQQQIGYLKAASSAEDLLYGPGIDDSL